MFKNGWLDPHHWNDLEGGVEGTAFYCPGGASPMFQNFMDAIIGRPCLAGRRPQAQALQLSLSDR